MKNVCFKCIVGMMHPFHDNGTVNKACPTREFSGVDWFDEEREDRERIQDGT